MDFFSQLDFLGISPTEEQLLQCRRYYNFLIDRNQVMNLTTITEREDVYLKHFLDSLHLLKATDLEGKTLLDVGSGAGFPAIPIKIFFPSVKITIVDALQKRIGFLKDLLQVLGIEGVELIHGRAEELKLRESFDIVTARAIAKLNVLAELCIPFVKVGGVFVAMKSLDYQEELAQASNAVRTLGAKEEKVVIYPLSDDLSHSLLVFKKIKQTPSIYPRTFASIKKKPL